MVIAPDTVNCGVLIIDQENVDKFMGFSYVDR